jgi:hypothetical protein
VRRPGGGAPVPGDARGLRCPSGPSTSRPSPRCSGRSTAGRWPRWCASSATSSLAEEAVQDAFVVAVQKRPGSGLPPNPGGWIMPTARRRAIDRLRREATRADRHAQAALLHLCDDEPEKGPVQDDRLRLIFTCCHPALSTEAQIALTLRLLGGLQTSGNRSSVPRPRLDDGPALGASKTQDPGRRGPVPGAGRDRAAQPTPRGHSGRLPGLQRRVQRGRHAMTSSASNSASKQSRNPSLNLTARTLFWDG